MEARFNAILEKIEKSAENFGKRINSRIAKIGTYSCFIIVVLLLGFLTFSSNFFRSLFGIKRLN